MTIETQAPRLGRLPTVPGRAPGIVAVREGARGKIYTLQCERCFITEEPKHIQFATFHFHFRSQGSDNPRLCRECRVTAYPDCICDYCQEDRREEKNP